MKLLTVTVLVLYALGKCRICILPNYKSFQRAMHKGSYKSGHFI